MHDAFGNAVHSSSAAAAAVRAYDLAVDRYLHALPGVLEATEEALTHDPGFALAHVLRGLFLAMYARGDEARQCLSSARNCVGGASDCERDHVALIGAIIEARIHDALSAVELHANRYPTDVVAIAPALGAYELFAFSGRADHDAARLRSSNVSLHTFRVVSPGCWRIGAGAALSTAPLTRDWRWCSRPSRSVQRTDTTRTW